MAKPILIVRFPDKEILSSEQKKYLFESLKKFTDDEYHIFMCQGINDVNQREVTFEIVSEYKYNLTSAINADDLMIVYDKAKKS